MKAFTKTIDPICEKGYPSEWWFLGDNPAHESKIADFKSKIDRPDTSHSWLCGLRIQNFYITRNVYTGWVASNPTTAKRTIERSTTAKRTIERSRTLPKNKLSKSQEKKEKLIRAKKLFDNLLPTLIQEHKGKYVAIVEGNVEIGDDKNNLLNRVIDKYGYVSMYFDKISDEKKVIKLSNRPRRR